MVKFTKRLEDIPLIVGVDLALYKTGISWYNPKTQKIVKAEELEVKKSESCLLLKLFQLLSANLHDAVQEYGEVMLIREALPNQCGFRSSIGALQGLAKAHAVLDLCRDLREGVDEYDDTGVHSVSVRAFYRTESIPKPEKSDIRKAVVKYYDLDDSTLTDNISDSIAVVHTLVHRKWNQDIEEEIKQNKKEIKKLKVQKAIDARLKQIEYLQKLRCYYE